jgi:hypothetical protein
MKKATQASGLTMANKVTSGLKSMTGLSVLSAAMPQGGKPRDPATMCDPGYKPG